MIDQLLLVLGGGALGAAGRYLIGLLALNLGGPAFPWGTLSVNLLGSFLIGLLFALAGRMQLPAPDMQLFLITGVLGGLTTFSAFSLETVNAFRAGWMIQSAANILINNIGGLAMAMAGIWLGGWIHL